MILLDRMALIVRPKRRFVDWVNGLGITPKLTIEEARTNPTVYLVAGIGDGDGPTPLSDVVDNYAEGLFEAQLEGWSDDESAWPQSRSPHTFRQYFDAEMAEVVEDVDEDLPIGFDDDPDFDDDDDVDDDDDDADSDEDDDFADVAISDEALEELSGVMRHCAWCGKDITEGRGALPVGFARRQPAADVDEGPIVEFPMPRAGRVLTGVRPLFDAEGGADTTVLLTVCSEACRAGLVVAVEEEKKG